MLPPASMVLGFLVSAVLRPAHDLPQLGSGMQLVAAPMVVLYRVVTFPMKMSRSAHKTGNEYFCNVES
jgi:hypothetical protein